MTKITIQDGTTKNPISLMGYEAGVCYGSDITDDAKNFKRGITCVKDGHGRLMEMPPVYITVEGYSARFVREFYTHISGGPTRMQASTRYIKYGEFDYIIPASIESNEQAKQAYIEQMLATQECYRKLEELHVPKEDIANILPLGMTSTFVCRTNLRNLSDMSHQRLCTRAYWEYRNFMHELIAALHDYSNEWAILIDDCNLFVPKCELSGYCVESRCCGRKPKKDN